MVKTFSLLKLPSLAQQNVVKIMDCPAKITFSMCSQKMKDLVRRLNFRAKRFRAFIGGAEIRVTSGEAHIDIRFWCEENDPGSFTILGMYWDSTARSLRDWMDCLKYIYTCDKYSLLFIDGCQKFDVQFIRREFKRLELDEVRLIGRISNEYYIEVLHTFVPVKQLMISKNPFPTRDALRSIICRPFDSLSLHWGMETSFIDLININAIELECWRCEITEEDLNVFFKLWVHGEYPRLRVMYLKIVSDDFTVNEALEEIEYEEKMKNEEGEEIKQYWVNSLSGKKAAIWFREWGRCMDVNFKVYN